MSAESGLHGSDALLDQTKLGPHDETEEFNDGTNVIIVGLSQRTTEKDLNEIASKYGQVAACNLIVDPHSEVSRGFAFVKMVDRESSTALIAALNGSTLDNHIVSARLSRRGGARPPTPGKYLGGKRLYRPPPYRYPPPPPRYRDPYDDYYHPPHHIPPRDLYYPPSPPHPYSRYDRRHDPYYRPRDPYERDRDYRDRRDYRERDYYPPRDYRDYRDHGSNNRDRDPKEHHDRERERRLYDTVDNPTDAGSVNSTTGEVNNDDYYQMNNPSKMRASMPLQPPPPPSSHYPYDDYQRDAYSRQPPPPVYGSGGW